MLKNCIIWGAIGYLACRFLKSRELQGLGQDARPRWGYRYNLEQWRQGIVPPGSPRIEPRGGGYRVGTRQYYQPGR